MGRLDLLLRAAGGGDTDVELVDFKTAVKRPPGEHHKNQLRLYAEAARRRGLNPVRLIIHDLDAGNGGQLVIDENRDEAERFRSDVHSWVQEIAAGQFGAPRRSSTYPSCDVSRMCNRA